MPPPGQRSIEVKKSSPMGRTVIEVFVYQPGFASKDGPAGMQKILLTGPEARDLCNKLYAVGKWGQPNTPQT